MDYGSGTTGYIWTKNSGMSFFFFFGISAKLTHIFSHIYLNFLQDLHILNSLEITIIL